MTDKEYNQLICGGFSQQQINQITKLQEYITFNTIVKYINSDCEVEHLRAANEIFKNHEADENLLLYIAGHINPYVYMDENISIDRIEALNKILIRYTNSSFDEKFLPIVDFLLASKADGVLLEITNNMLCYEEKNFEDMLKPEFDRNQLLYAYQLAFYGYPDYIEKIPELKYYPNTELIFQIHNLDMDLIEVVNAYDSYNLESMILQYKDGKNVNPILLNSKNPNRVALCARLMDLEMSNDDIRKCLDDVNAYYFKMPIYVVNQVIDLTKNGCTLNKYEQYICELPSTTYPQYILNELELSVVSAIYNKNLDEDVEKEYLELFHKNFDKHLNYNYEDQDVLKIIDLYKSNIDVSYIIKSGLKKDEINILIDASEKINKPLDEVFDRCYYGFEIKAVKQALDFERYDIVEAFIVASNPDRDVYDTIFKILQKDKENHTYHKIINLLYDKGNDAFNDYDYYYEFDEYQKTLLTDVIYNESLTEGQIDNIRDNTIDAGKMEALVDILIDGYSINEILKKINDLDKEDIEALGHSLRLGFSLSFNDKEICK